MCSIRQSTRSKTIHAFSRARARSFIIHALMHACAHSFIRRGHSRRASTRRERRREDRSFSLVLSLSPLVRRPIVTSRVVIERASTPLIDRSSARGVSRGLHRARGWDERARARVSTRVRSIGSTPHLNNLRVDGEHVSRQTRSDDDDDDDDDDKRSTDPSTDRVPRAPSP